MLFDIRKNLLMVRVVMGGQPVYNFYNACGREYQLTGPVWKEIVERQFSGSLHVQTVWGQSVRIDRQTFIFDESGDMLIRLYVGPYGSIDVPVADVTNGDSIFNVIDGVCIEDSMRGDIRAHLRATNRPVENIVWYHDMSDTELRIVLKSFGQGPMRIDKADTEGLHKIWETFIERHDDVYKYTHRAIGIEDDEKIPADLRPESLRPISKRSMAPNKTVELMNVALFDILKVMAIIPVDAENGLDRQQLHDIVFEWYKSLEDDRLSTYLRNPQFTVNFIYGMLPDYDWKTINDETEDYQQSLVRAALIELEKEFELNPRPELKQTGACKLPELRLLSDVKWNIVRRVLRTIETRCALGHDVLRIGIPDVLKLLEQDDVLSSLHKSQLVTLANALSYFEATKQNTEYLKELITYAALNIERLSDEAEEEEEEEDE